MAILYSVIHVPVNLKVDGVCLKVETFVVTDAWACVKMSVEKLLIIHEQV